MNRSFVRRLAAVLGAGALASATLAVSTGAAGAAKNESARPPASSSAVVRASVSHVALQRIGTKNATVLAASTTHIKLSKSTEKVLIGDTQTITRTKGSSSAAPSVPTNFPVKTKAPSNAPSSAGFAGITGSQQASANNAYDLEPPDQGLCSNGTYVVEVVNNAYAVYSTSGTILLGPIATTSLLGIPSENAGSFVSDPHCYYDQSLNRWFVVELSIPNLFAAHRRATRSYELISVSDTSSPTGAFTTFAIDSTDPSDPGCPCFGDYPMIGTDAYGFYLTTNEFSIYRPNFNGVQLYAMSKQELASAADGGSAPTVLHFSNLPSPFPAESVGETYHLSPALVPNGGAFDMSQNGTEYFTMSDAFPVTSDLLATYAMTNTASLASSSPSVSLTSTLVTVQSYQFPETGLGVAQKAFPAKSPPPLLSYIESQTGTSVPEGVLQADFDAVQETTYAAGHLYTELSNATSPTAPVGTTTAEWFELTPSVGSSGVSATLANQGNVAVAGQSLLYPDLAVNSSGAGDMVFTLTGTKYYPSAAYVSFGSSGPTGNVTVTGVGSGPEDGFTCYAYYVGPNYGGCRWGDFSGAIAVGKNVWMATEYIPPNSGQTARDFYTNWGTFIFHENAG